MSNSKSYLIYQHDLLGKMADRLMKNFGIQSDEKAHQFYEIQSNRNNALMDKKSLAQAAFIADLDKRLARAIQPYQMDIFDGEMLGQIMLEKMALMHALESYDETAH